MTGSLRLPAARFSGALMLVLAPAAWRGSCWFPISRIHTIMKLISINREYSDKRKVAFRAEPQIDAPVFDQIRRLLQQSATLRGVGGS